MPLRMKPEARDEILGRNAMALMVVTVTLGGVITASSKARWAAPVWRDALRVPNAPTTWGVVLLIGGLLLLFGQWLDEHDHESRRVLRVGYGIGWLWSSCLAAVQFSAFIHDVSGTANAIGFIIWIYMAFLFRLRFGGTDAKNYA